MLSFLLLIALRISWVPVSDIDSYRVYFMQGGNWVFVGEVVEDFLITPLPSSDTTLVAVSSVKNETESALSSPLELPQFCDGLEDEIVRLRKACGKKCSKVPSVVF